VSTALTVPTIPSASTAPQGLNLTGVNPKGCEYVAILMAQTVGCYIRTDGSAVIADVTGGLLLSPGDFRIVYGLQALKNIRVIRAIAGGSLAVEYYYYRPARAI
jgi:hypothetical protein